MTDPDFAVLESFAIANGLALFPIPAGCKAPIGIVRSHAEDWSTDPEQWKTWRAKNPDCNFGVECGPSNLIVIDIDVIDGVQQFEAYANWWRANVDDQAPSPSVQTPSGGAHVYFRVPPEAENRRWGQPKLAPGIDVRAGNGYVVAPFSRTDRARDSRIKADGQYVLLREEIELAPPALIDHCTRTEESKAVRRRDVPLAFDGYPIDRLERDRVQPRVNVALAALRKAAEGDRNNELFRASASIGVHVADGAMDSVVAENLLSEAARDVGLGADEIRTTIRSGIKRGENDGGAWAGNPADAFSHVQAAAGPSTVAPWRQRISRIKNIGEFCAEYEPVSYAIDGVVQSSKVYTLTAATGSGKTAFLVIAALAIATGRRDLLGRDICQGRVVYCAFENPDDVRMRFMIAAWRFGIDLDDLGDKLQILAARCSAEEILSKLSVAAAADAFALIVVDTLQAAFDGSDLNDNVQTGNLIRRLRELTIRLPGHPAVIIAAHPTKNAGADNQVPYGGGAMLNEIDTNLTLKKEGAGIVTLYWQGKLRGVDFMPTNYRIDLITSPQILDAKDRLVQLPVMWPATVADVEAQMKKEFDVGTRLLRAMANGPRETQRSWALSIGVRVSTVNYHLKRLKKLGFAEQTAEGWGLTSKGQREVEKCGGASKPIVAPNLDD